MRKIEFLLFVFFAITIAAKYSEIPGGKNLILFSGACIVVFYFLSAIGLTRNTFFLNAIFHSDEEEQPEAIMKTLAGLVFSFSFITIVFNEMIWRGRDILLIIDVSLLTFLTLFSMIYLENSAPRTNRFILFRFILFSLILVFFSITPIKKRLEWQYSDQYYREILLYAIENPDDPDAQSTVSAYERRMNGMIPFEEETED